MAPFADWQERTDRCAALQTSLAAEVRFDSENAPETLNRLEQLSGLRILPTDGAQERMRALVGNRPYFSVLKRDMTLAEALDSVVLDCWLAWEVRGGEVVLGLEEEIEGWMRYRVYTIEDLVAWSLEREAGEAPEEGSHDQAISEDCLLRTIRHFVEPEVWKMAASRLDALRGHLVVEAPGYVCDDIEAYLASLRTPSDD